jgi:predicted NBD/HSP70 family sugar kinase
MLLDQAFPRTASQVRELSLTAVLNVLRAHPRCSRSELAAHTGLSKPTVGAAITALAAGGLVRACGRTTGQRGPSASLYEFVPDAAVVLAVDIGARRVRAVIADMDDQLRAEVEEELTRAHIDDLLRALRAIAKRFAGSPIELATVGSPGIVDPPTGRVRSCPQIRGWEGIEAEKALSTVLGARTIVENDVNLAALGELAHGAGKGRSSFAYLSVGSGVGAGLVLNGQLFRGSHGAAGEVGFLAVGTTQAGAASPSRGTMEMRLSGEALVDFAHRSDPTASDDPRELFAAARTGDPLGRAVVAEAVEGIAACVASINAVTDLELVLLGGGIGSQSDVLLEPVRAAVTTLVPYTPEIRSGALGDQATLAGAAATGVEHARAALIKRCLS